MSDVHRGPLTRPMRALCCRYASSRTRLAVKRMCTSAPIHSSSSLEVVRTCVRTPVSGSVFMDTAVRVLLCSGSDLANVMAASLSAPADLFNVHVRECRT